MKALQPGDTVICEVKPSVLRSGVFVRYVKRRAWPLIDDHERCAVKFKHNLLPVIMDSSKVRLDASPAQLKRKDR